MNKHESSNVVAVDGVLLDSIEDTKRKLKLGRTKIYQLIAAGHLQVVKVGRTTRVVAASTQRLVSDLLRQQA